MKATHQANFNLGIDARAQPAIGIAKVRVGAEQRLLHAGRIRCTIQNVVIRLYIAVEGYGTWRCGCAGQEQQLLARLLVQLAHAVRSRIAGEQLLLECLVRLVVLLSLCKCEQVAFSCEERRQKEGL